MSKHYQLAGECLLCVAVALSQGAEELGHALVLVHGGVAQKRLLDQSAQLLGLMYANAFRVKVNTGLSKYTHPFSTVNLFYLHAINQLSGKEQVQPHILSKGEKSDMKQPAVCFKIRQSGRRTLSNSGEM